MSSQGSKQAVSSRPSGQDGRENNRKADVNGQEEEEDHTDVGAEAPPERRGSLQL